MVEEPDFVIRGKERSIHSHSYFPTERFDGGTRRRRHRV